MCIDVSILDGWMDDKKNVDASNQMGISDQLQPISHWYQQINFLSFLSNSIAVGGPRQLEAASV